MKFKLLSDLHLEFYKGELWEPTAAAEDKDTVLLLPGDIDTGKNAKPWIEKMCGRFYHVVYCLGNHEFYGNEWYKVKDFWKEVDMPDNFTFLDDGVMFLDGVRIIGGTLWTGIRDQTDNYEFTVWNGKMQMNDYRTAKINYERKGQYRKLNPHDTVNAHRDTLDYIKAVLGRKYEGKTIVMTHHLPHNDCVPKRFEGAELNAFFVTNLDYLIDNFDIDVWIHGHTHDNVDIEVHGTRILCNPMGYHGFAINEDFNEGLIFEC